MNIEYTLFDLLIFLFSTASCALYKNAKRPKFIEAFIAMLVVSGFFLLWDQAVTNYWWQFNPHYILGPKMGRLPIEEVAFFFAIPWSCLIIWENLKDRSWGATNVNVEALMMLVGAVAAATSLISGRWYTAFVSGAVIVVGAMSLFSAHWLRKKVSWFFVGIIFVLILIFNTYLTARPILLYNPATMSNFRLGSIPVEDIFYGLTLITGIAIVYDALVKVHSKRMV